MLIKRIVTAIVLLAVLLPALFFGSPNAFNALLLLIISAGVWEWSRMNGYSHPKAIFFALDSFLICAGLMYIGLARYAMPLFWAITTALWIFISSYLLAMGVTSWGRVPRSIRLLVGLLLICTAWLAAAQLRQMGINLLLSTLLLVWTADICAYAAGRLLGGKLFGSRKLAITISPGKSWEGVLGGFAGVCLLAYLWLWIDQKYATDSLSLYTLLHQVLGKFMSVALAFITILAVVGDLLESLVKRSAGIKDSSALLPGHGGVLDRVDALLPVLPAAMLLVSGL